MSGVKIPRGTISIHTFPVNEQGDAYRTCCEDYSVSIFIEPPIGLKQYFQKAADASHVRYDTARNVYTPCVIDRRVHHGLSHHSAWLLSPPDINTKSELFVPGLLIPDLRLTNIIERGFQLMGFVLNSDYAQQEFFVSPKAQIDNTSKYQGMVYEIPHNKRKQPVARIILSSKGNEEIFEENSKTLEEIANSNLNFWWNINLDN